LLQQSSIKVKVKEGVKHSNGARVFHHFHVVFTANFFKILLKRF
jgi:hypothetical protein